MASHKRSAKAKQVAEFKSQLGGMDDLFAREDKRREQASLERQEALYNKACTSKNRYSTKGEAQLAIRSCEEYGTYGLHCYRCEYCNGWHLTSKPRRD